MITVIRVTISHISTLFSSISFNICDLLLLSTVKCAHYYSFHFVSQVKVQLLDGDGLAVHDTIKSKAELMQYVAAMIPKLKSRLAFPHRRLLLTIKTDNLLTAAPFTCGFANSAFSSNFSKLLYFLFINWVIAQNVKFFLSRND